MTESFHSDHPNSRGGPIAALVIGIPASVFLWSILITALWILFK